MTKAIIAIAALIVLCAGAAQSDILNVPEDHETIQAGINASDDGDTVLVQPGEYVEYLSFFGHNIVIGSLFLTTGNEEFITETIIDGDGQKSVVSFVDEETEEAQLIGFTIQNGDHFPGGGIYIYEANPKLSWLIVSNNHSSRDGGGIYMRRSESKVTNCTISENTASRYGGGIYISQSSVDIINCKVMQNSAESNGGGILIFASTCLINRCLITNNDADRCGGIRFNGDGMIKNCTIANNSLEGASYGLSIYEGIVSVTNSIIWSDIVYLSAECEFQYSVIESGADGMDGDLDQMAWGEGNIEDDPQFVDLENNDYQLTDDSPCIDSGDPEGEADSDGTRADIGAIPTYRGMLVLEGSVHDNSNDEPLANTTLSTSYGDTTYSDSTGFWRFAPARFGGIEVTASIFGYIDSTVTDIELEVNDTLEVLFTLFHPVINPAVEEISEQLAIGETTEISFIVENSGDGILNWSTKARLRGEIGNDPGTQRRSLPIGMELDDNSINGVIFTGERYLVSGQNNGRPLIYILDENGRLEGALDQPFNDERGIHDLAWDGELIWGGIGDEIYGMDLEGEIIDRFELENERGFIRNVAYDTANDWIWICESRSDIIACNRQGEIQNVINLNGLRTYGLAYWEDDPDGYTIYLIIRLLDEENCYISKINPETENIQFITFLDPPLSRPRGAFLTSNMDNYSTVIMTINDLSVDNGGDRLDIRQLHSNIGWLTINPLEGALNPSDERDFFLRFDTTELLPIVYPAELVFSHNAVGGETIIPVDLMVTEPNAVIAEQDMLLQEFAITAAFPNPFNSSVRLNYSIPQTSQVSIKVYDITGSRVDQIANTVHQSGQHSVIWDASTMPSGIYFARMESNQNAQTVKLILMK